MDDRVFLALAFAEVGEDFSHVGVLEQLDNVVHGPGDGVGHVHAGDLGKQLAEERIGLRQVVRRHLAGEGLARRRVDPRGEQAVGQRLREHVGELLLVEVGDERFAEGGQPVVQPALFLLVLERADDQVADDPRHARHALGQFLGGGDGQGRLLEKGGEQLRELLVRRRATA